MLLSSSTWLRRQRAYGWAPALAAAHRHRRRPLSIALHPGLAAGLSGGGGGELPPFRFSDLCASLSPPGGAAASPEPDDPALSPRPGVVGLELYMPHRYVDQAKLERYDGVSPGKYTQGLGQQAMAYVDVDEDVQSMALTVTENLLERHGVRPQQVGRLEVGTESMVDKSKSVKSTVMSLLNRGGAYDVEGVDCLNACYGGTAALFNALAWMHSPEYDGRLALVLAGDVAVYPPGPARPTGGAGMVGLLLGPEGMITLDAFRHSHMEHAYDFYKPHLDSEYPLVDGHLSNDCYQRALAECWRGYRRRFARHHGYEPTLGRDIQFSLFHHPYARLVRKSFAALWGEEHGEPDPRRQLAGSEALYRRMVEPSTRLRCQLGNLYTGSLYASLLSLLHHQPSEDLLGARLSFFSYGSGLTATLFSGQVRPDAGEWLDQQRRQLDLAQRLERRTEASPEEYAAAMQRRQRKAPPAEAPPLPAEAPPPHYVLAGLDANTCHRDYQKAHRE